MNGHTVVKMEATASSSAAQLSSSASSSFVIPFIRGASVRRNGPVVAAGSLQALVDLYKAATSAGAKAPEPTFAAYVAHVPGAESALQPGPREFSLMELVTNPRLTGPGTDVMDLEKSVFDTALSLEPGPVPKFDPTPLGFGERYATEGIRIDTAPAAAPAPPAAATPSAPAPKLTITIKAPLTSAEPAASHLPLRLTVADPTGSDGSESDKQQHKKKKKEKKEKHKHKDKSKDKDRDKDAESADSDDQTHHKKKKKKHKHSDVVNESNGDT